MNPVRKAALRLEMAEGHVQMISQQQTFDSHDLEHAVMIRDGARSEFQLAIRGATEIDPQALARLLAL